MGKTSNDDDSAGLQASANLAIGSEMQSVILEGTVLAGYEGVRRKMRSALFCLEAVTTSQ